MYLGVLDEHQQALFFRAASHVAEIDGLDPREEALLEEARIECAAGTSGPGPVEDLNSILSELKVLNHAGARNAFVLELAGVVAADRSVSDAELLAFTEIAATVGFDRNRIHECIRLAERWRDLADETTMFLGEE